MAFAGMDGELDEAQAHVGAVGGYETPFLPAGVGVASAPDWYQRLLFELSSGDPADPRRDAFLRKAKASARCVVDFETVRRWLLITRITARRTGLLALSARRGAELDDFTFALVDLVCELRLADHFDIGLDDKIVAAWDLAKKAAPADARVQFRLPAGDPVRLYNACLSLLAEDECDAAVDRMIADARVELIHASRYGSLNSEERRVVRAMAQAKENA